MWRKFAKLSVLLFVTVLLCGLFSACDFNVVWLLDIIDPLPTFEIIAPPDEYFEDIGATTDMPKETAAAATPTEEIYHKTEKPTETPAPATKTSTPAKTPAAATEKPVSKIPGVEYLDLEAIKQIYVNPGVRTEIDIENPASWKIDSNSIFKIETTNGKMFVTASDTGYANMTSKNGDKAILYSIKPAEKSDSRKKSSTLPYYLYYEKGSHTLTVYTFDDDGYYTVPIKTICAACGAVPSKTPIGVFSLKDKLRWKEFSASSNAPYAIKYNSGVYLHGPCYYKQSQDTLAPQTYNEIGTNSTGGCLRMQAGNIYWIYVNCDRGTPIEIAQGNPLGTECEKPKTLGQNVKYDPTDPFIIGRAK